MSGDFATITVDESIFVAPGDYGTHPFVLTVDSLTFSGTVTQQTFNFNVIVDCIVTTLTFTSTPPASTTVIVGIDAQPVTLAFATS